MYLTPEEVNVVHKDSSSSPRGICYGMRGKTSLDTDSLKRVVAVALFATKGVRGM